MSIYDKHKDQFLRLKKKHGVNEASRRIGEQYGYAEAAMKVAHHRATKRIANVSNVEPKSKDTGVPLDENSTKWDISKRSATWEYKGNRSITTLEQALEFCEADLTKYEVERYVFNSWDVTMKVDEEPVLRTNYQTKVWFKIIERIEIPKVKVEPLKFGTTEKAQMWVIVGCIHRPFHDKKLWKAFLHYLHDNKKKIHGLVINGDYLDLRSLSSHDEYIPAGISLGIEYADGLKGMMEIKNAAGKEYDRWEKVFQYGNHEDRFNRNKKELAKYGDALIIPEEALRLHEDNWKVNNDYQDGYVTLGNSLSVFHGAYHGTDAAKKHLSMIADESCVFNHTHRIQSYSNGTHTAYNIGWMGDVTSDGFKYGKRHMKSQWKQGFAEAYIDRDGWHYVRQVGVQNSRFVSSAKIY